MEHVRGNSPGEAAPGVGHFMTGEDIRRWRLARGLSQAELAELLGVAENTVWRWETGLRSPDPRLIALAIKGLECELLTRKDHEQG